MTKEQEKNNQTLQIAIDKLISELEDEKSKASQNLDKYSEQGHFGLAAQNNATRIAFDFCIQKLIALKNEKPKENTPCEICDGSGYVPVNPTSGASIPQRCFNCNPVQTCIECDGTGVFRVYYTNHCNKEMYRDKTCLFCDGTGERELA